MFMIYRVFKIIWSPFIVFFGLIIPVYRDKPYLVMGQCTLFFFLISSNYLVRIESYGTILFFISWAFGIGIGAILVIKGPDLELEERKVQNTSSVISYQLNFFLLSLAGLLIILYSAWLDTNMQLTWIPIFVSLGWFYVLSNIYSIQHIKTLPKTIYGIAFIWTVAVIIYLFRHYFLGNLSYGLYYWWMKIMILAILIYESIDAFRLKKIVAFWYIVLCACIVVITGDLKNYIMNRNLKDILEVVVLIFIIQSILLRCMHILKRNEKVS